MGQFKGKLHQTIWMLLTSTDLPNFAQDEQCTKRMYATARTYITFHGKEVAYAVYQYKCWYSTLFIIVSLNESFVKWGDVISVHIAASVGVR